jgi:hypothetical protein
VLSSAKRAMFSPLKEASSILSLVAWIISVTEVENHCRSLNASYPFFSFLKELTPKTLDLWV